MNTKRIIEEKENITTITFIGQAGFIIKSKSGMLLGIDLYLSDYVEKLEGHMGYKRLLPKILMPSDMVFDVIITTHSHGDHYDKDSMEELMSKEKTILLASEKCEEIIENQIINKKNVLYKRPGDDIIIKDYYISFVNCDHGKLAEDAFGVVIQVDKKTIYEIGDSCLRTDYAKEIVDRFHNIDILIGPINGAYGNMNEEEFSKYIDIIKPKLAIPCHYGMFASHGGNPGKFLEIMRNDYPTQNVILMTQGEQIEI